MELSKQTVLVTGASRGLGAALATAFANEGANVIGNYYKSNEKAEDLVKTLGEKAVAIQADVRDKDQVNEMVAKAKGYFQTPITTIANPL